MCFWINVEWSRELLSDCDLGDVCWMRRLVDVAARFAWTSHRELTYFSRRICGTGRPYSFKALNAASTMSGLPQR